VVAYVDAYCNDGSEDVGGAVRNKLEKCGATVLSRWSDTVTHVVFKSGRRATVERVEQKNALMDDDNAEPVHIVSTSWVKA
jgi:phage gp37-like protein